VIAPEDFISTSWARALPVYIEIFSQREHLPELEKPMGEQLCVGDDRTELSRRDLLHPEEGAGSRPEEDLILDDVPDAGENRLVEEDVRDLGVRECADFFQRGPRIPSIRHDVGGEVVLGLCVIALYPFDRCRPHSDFTVRQVHHQSRRARAAIVSGD
jgi:hypothetical protein